MKFYSYLWLRDDGTPYYAGKGTGRRAFRSAGHGVHCPPDRTRVIVYPVMSEAEAFDLEMTLIAWYGRKDIGTGCLRNLSGGGEGPTLSVAHRKKLSEAHMGHVSSRKGKKLSEKEKQNLKGWAKGHIPWNTDKMGGSWSQARRDSFERRGVSEQTRQKQRLAKLGNKNRLGGKKYELQPRAFGEPIHNHPSNG